MHLFKFLTFTAITSLALYAATSQAAPLVPSTPPPAYVLENTEVHNIPAPGLKRDYDIFVSLPDSYASSKKSYPVLFVTDANYAFPLMRSISRRLLGHGGPVQEFILIGLSYAKGDNPTASRNRDYTPSDIIAKKRADKAQQVYQYGQAEAYRHYLAQQVLPYVAQHFRADMQNTALLGHSYGGLLGAYILSTAPGMFRSYILSSPSLWYDQHEVFKLEQAYAARHKDLAARVYLLAGEFEKVKKGDPRFNQTEDLVADALRFEKILQSRRYPSLQVKSEMIPNEDHLTVAPITATRGVMWAFAKK